MQDNDLVFRSRIKFSFPQNQFRGALNKYALARIKRRTYRANADEQNLDSVSDDALSLLILEQRL